MLWNYAVNPNGESEGERNAFTHKPATFLFLKVNEWQHELFLFQYWEAAINSFHHIWWIRYTAGWVLIPKIIISDLLFQIIVYLDRKIAYMTVFLNFHNTDISCQTVNQKEFILTSFSLQNFSDIEVQILSVVRGSSIKSMLCTVRSIFNQDR